jgi:hypothetical protein
VIAAEAVEDVADDGGVELALDESEEFGVRGPFGHGREE